MNIGFNIIEKREYPDKIFKERVSIIEFLRKVLKESKLPYNFAVFGLEALLYHAEDMDEISRYIRNLLQDKTNFLVRGNYIIQMAIDGKIEVVETYERPRIKYKDKEFLIYPIFGRVKQIDLKHFIAPLNLQS
ncbi:hypothetical protein DRO24_01775 [Candidatus Bathyarchaeota archaeon]|nr:MAG: hypothetical protein DRO24_01775 [Candidatus Bathyarchaeota archaeon]